MATNVYIIFGEKRRGNSFSQWIEGVYFDKEKAEKRLKHLLKCEYDKKSKTPWNYSEYRLETHVTMDHYNDD